MLLLEKAPSGRHKRGGSTTIRRAAVVLLLVLMSASCLPVVGSQGQIGSEAQAGSEGQLQVLATIAPLARIVRELGGDAVAVNTLIPPDQTPHNFTLKMSHRHQLENAQLLVWLGPDLEPWLAKLASSGQSLVFGNIPSTDTAHSHSPHRHDAATHPWLVPQRAQDFARRLVTELTAQQPGRAELFEAMLRGFRERLELLETDASLPLPEAPRSYAVAHDAYSEFARAFGLPQPVVLASSAEVSPGAKTLLSAARRLHGGYCLLVDINHRRRWVEKFASDQALRLMEVDLLGTGYATYAGLLDSLNRTIRNCL